VHNRTGLMPFTGIGAQDGALVARPYERQVGPHRLAPRVQLMGWDPRTGAFAYNLSQTAVFYSISVEAATGDLVGFGLCCSTKHGPSLFYVSRPREHGAFI
jgi:hypothetical protein